MQKSAATAVSKSLRSFSCFTDFRGEGGSLALGLLQKVNSSTEKLFCVEKMTWKLKRPLRRKFVYGGAKIRAKKSYSEFTLGSLHRRRQCDQRQF